MKPRLNTGSESAATMRLVQRVLRTRGYRAPLALALPDMSASDRSEISLWAVRALALEAHELAAAGAALRALEGYYASIGAAFDAARMRDMRIPVDLVLEATPERRPSPVQHASRESLQRGSEIMRNHRTRSRSPCCCGVDGCDCLEPAEVLT